MLLLSLYIIFTVIVFLGMLLLDVSGYLKGRGRNAFKPWYPKAIVIIPVTQDF